jgi:hypothetical protein
MKADGQVSFDIYTIGSSKPPGQRRGNDDEERGPTGVLNSPEQQDEPSHLIKTCERDKRATCTYTTERKMTLGQSPISPIVSYPTLTTGHLGALLTMLCHA